MQAQQQIKANTGLIFHQSGDLNVKQVSIWANPWSELRVTNGAERQTLKQLEIELDQSEAEFESTDVLFLNFFFMAWHARS